MPPPPHSAFGLFDIDDDICRHIISINPPPVKMFRVQFALQSPRNMRATATTAAAAATTVLSPYSISFFLSLYAKPNADLFLRYRNQPERTFLRSLCIVKI